MRIKDGFELREICGEHVILRMGWTILISARLFR